MSNKKEFELKLILNFYNKNEKDNCEKLIKEIGYEKYQQFLLFGEGGYVSPIFNIYQNQIGNAYKYDSSIQDYTNYGINFEIRKIFFLYLNYLKLLKRPIINNDIKFHQYYIVNQKWINNYKTYYEYDQISKEIDKNTFIQNILNNLLN